MCVRVCVDPLPNVAPHELLAVAAEDRLLEEAVDKLMLLDGVHGFAAERASPLNHSADGLEGDAAGVSLGGMVRVGGVTVAAEQGAQASPLARRVPAVRHDVDVVRHFFDKWQMKRRVVYTTSTSTSRTLPPNTPLTPRGAPLPCWPTTAAYLPTFLSLARVCARICPLPRKKCNCRQSFDDGGESARAFAPFVGRKSKQGRGATAASHICGPLSRGCCRLDGHLLLLLVVGVVVVIFPFLPSSPALVSSHPRVRGDLSPAVDAYQIGLPKQHGSNEDELPGVLLGDVVLALHVALSAPSPYLRTSLSLGSSRARADAICANASRASYEHARTTTTPTCVTLSPPRARGARELLGAADAPVLETSLNFISMKT